MRRPKARNTTRSRMRTIRRSRSLMDRLPDPVREFLSRRASELIGLGLLALMVVVALALASWSVDDPSLNNATNGAVRNWLGRPGAMIADLLMQLVGLGVIPDYLQAALPGRPRVEIGWQLDKAVWGQGLAPEGARAWLAYGWGTLGLTEIVAFTAAINRPSRRVMEKIGMARDPAEDFDHPRLPDGHPLRRHVLYRIGAPRRAA